MAKIASGGAEVTNSNSNTLTGLGGGGGGGAPGTRGSSAAAATGSRRFAHGGDNGGDDGRGVGVWGGGGPRSDLSVEPVDLDR